MTDDTDSSGWGTTRRTMLCGSLAATLAAGVGTTEAADGTTTDEDRPTVGLVGGIETLNPFTAPRDTPPSPETVILRAVYDSGIVFDPETTDPVPWVFADWELREENVGTDDPAIVARVRDGLTFSDGVPLTAEDVAFTTRYVKRQNVETELLSTSDFQTVSAVRTDGNRVEYVLSESEPVWLGRILDQHVVPKHVWSGVEDATGRNPVADGGPVGSGAFTVASADLPNSVRLDARPEYPLAAPTPFLDDGPFVDGLRFQSFDSVDAVADALFGGGVDLSIATQTEAREVELGRRARTTDDLVTTSNPINGYFYGGYNLRRVPFDDLVFRRFLTRAWDDEFHVEDVYGGFGVDGDYPPAPPRRNLRPADPDAPESNRYPFFADENGNLDVTAARDYLRESDGDREYTFGSVESDLVTGDRELRIDGQRVPTVHTDNDGTSGQGPLEFLIAEGAGLYRNSWTRWVEVLQEIGVPVRERAVPFAGTPDNLINRVFGGENFDVYNVGFVRLGEQFSGIDDLFGAAGVDEDGDESDLLNNPQGYTGAQEAIDAADTMVVSDRREAVREAFQTIYDDAPVNVSDYDPVIQPYSREWTGVVDRIGGVTNRFTWLNLRRRVLSVPVDVKPGSDRNPINPASRGVTPVVVGGTGDVDPRAIDVGTLRFGPPDVINDDGGASPAHSGHLEDVDGDGSAELVVHFPTADAGFDDGDGTAVVVGELDSGRPIRGSDEVTLVGGGGNGNGAGGGSSGNGGGGNGSSGGNGGGGR